VSRDLFPQTGQRGQVFRCHQRSLGNDFAAEQKMRWAPGSGDLWPGGNLGCYAGRPWPAGLDTAFIEELQKLRPHLQPDFGTSKVAQALAMTHYDPRTDPKTAARAYHDGQAGKAKR